MIISMKLSKESMDNAIKELKAYKKSLPSKCVQFTEKLTECGISVAKQNSGQYGSYLVFGKEITETSTGAKAIFFGDYEHLVERKWLGKDGSEIVAYVNPLLMAEFGSGIKASDASEKKNAEIAIAHGAGRGTFPGQTHAKNDSGWSWMDLDGNWHHSTGEEPTMPVFNAYLEMIANIQKIAREVFAT